MAITALTTLPSGTSRIGSGTPRFTSTTDRQMRFKAAASSGNGPYDVIQNRDFLIFGRLGPISGVQSVPFWAYLASGTQFGLYVNNSLNTLGSFWRYGGATRDTTLSLATTLPDVIYMGGPVMWCWQRNGDQYRIGILNGNTGVMQWSAAVTSLAATLGLGANWTNYAAVDFFVNCSTGANYFAGIHSGINFVAVTTGELASAGLLDDTDVAAVMLDPQRIFDSGRSNILGRVSYGDPFRSGSRLIVRVPTDIVSGDQMVCPITSKALTVEIGTNSSASNKTCQWLPDYTVPTVTVATADCDDDNQTRAEHYPGNLISGSVCIQPVTVIATSSAKRHFWCTVTDLLGRRVRPAIPVPMTWHYTDTTAGPTYAKAVSYWTQIASSADNHWHMTAVIVNGSIVFQPTFHSEGYNTAGVVDTPASGDCGWGITQMLSYQDPASNSDTGFTLLTPQESRVTWTEAPGASSSHQQAISSYAAPSMPINGSGGYDGSYITAVRNLLTSSGWTEAIWYKTGFGSAKSKKLTAAGGSAAASIPAGTFSLGGSYFIVVFTPRYSGSGTFFGLHGVIGINDANFDNNSNWFSPTTGEVLDGTGPNAWTVGTLTTDNNEALNFGYPENDVSPLSDMAACTEYQISQTTGGYLCGMLAVGAATSVSSATPTLTQLIVRTWRFNAATKIMGIVDSVDIYAEVDAVLGNDPNISDADEASRIEAGYVIQPTTGGGFVVWMRSREQTTLTNGTHYTDFPTRYGVRVIGMYFHDPADLSKRTWLYEADGTTLYEAWHVTDDGGLSCGPLPVSNGTSPASNYVAVNVFVGVTSTATGMTIRPLVDASAPIAQAAQGFASVPISRYVLDTQLVAVGYYDDED